MKPITIVRLGGLALVFGAVAFLAVFSFLAARFDYPAILDGPANTVLPRLLATGTPGRTAWALYAFLPLIWFPAGVGAYCALRRFSPGAMLLALQFAALAAISMMLGLMRWPSVHWHLAQLHLAATAEQQQVIAAVFGGLNTYLGNYIGEFLGELSFSMFFLLSSWTYCVPVRRRPGLRPSDSPSPPAGSWACSATSPVWWPPSRPSTTTCCRSG